MEPQKRVKPLTIGLLCSLLLAVSRLGVTETPVVWPLTVIPTPTPVVAGEEVKFWIGVRNIGDTDRVICIRNGAYQLEDKNGGNRGGSLGNWWTTSCQSDSERHLLLAGETYFLLAAVTIPSHLVGSARLQLSVRLELTCPDDTLACDQAMIDARESREIHIAPPKKPG